MSSVCGGDPEGTPVFDRSGWGFPTIAMAIVFEISDAVFYELRTGWGCERSQWLEFLSVRNCWGFRAIGLAGIFE